MANIRKSIWNLLARDPWDDVTEDYAKAVATMQAKPADDPTSWTFQAAIHGSYSAPPPGALWNECQHASWFFLPWHRMYLYFFERIVRAAVIENGGDPEWALPYWNYDEPNPRNTLPKPLRTPKLPDNVTANALFLAAPRRDPIFVNGGQLPKAVTSPANAFRERNFIPGFGGPRSEPTSFNGGFGALEQTPHNDVHVQLGGRSRQPCLGGLMIDPACAALDPVFWLHHCNIDRLWKRWLALGGGRANPTDGEWLTQSFTFHDETGAAVSLTCADVLDTAAQLDYVYDDDVAAVTSTGRPMGIAPPTPPTPPGGPSEMVAASNAVELKGSRVSVALEVEPAARPRLGRPAGMGLDATDEALYLNVEDIDIDAPHNPGLVYGVYVNAPPGASPDERQQYHVGNVSLFGIEAVKDPKRPHAVPGLKHTFNISHVVSRLKAANRWNPATVNVTFEPVVPVQRPAPGMGIAEEMPQLRDAETTPVRIGRVSLFVG